MLHPFMELFVDLHYLALACWTTANFWEAMLGDGKPNYRTRFRGLFVTVIAGILWPFTLIWLMFKKKI
jgi:hypothetical protein